MDPNNRACPLCNSNSFPVEDDTKGPVYFRCEGCSSIFMNPERHPSEEEEKKRYLEHNNDINDKRYQEFVSPIVNEILSRFSKADKGLDFGAGTGPVITELLREKNYDIEAYDPFFSNRPELLEDKYDYIACCEVIEHFYHPIKEFGLLRALLKPGGALLCMSELYSEEIDFSKWYYRNDQTHVFFYHKKALEWIRDRTDFGSLSIKGRMIVLEA